MSATTATVETLTASVKTLVVGSRQITLSVAKQLDHVPFEDMEVMGRVRIGKSPGFEFIGKDRITGELVRSHVDGPGRYDYGDGEEEMSAYRKDHDNWVQRYISYPLIVLAGLK